MVVWALLISVGFVLFIQWILDASKSKSDLKYMKDREEARVQQSEAEWAMHGRRMKIYQNELARVGVDCKQLDRIWMEQEQRILESKKS